MSCSSRNLEPLQGVTPRDPVTLLAGAVPLALTAIVASLLPVRRAARLDPARSLRGQ